VLAELFLAGFPKFGQFKELRDLREIDAD